MNDILTSLSEEPYDEYDALGINYYDSNGKRHRATIVNSYEADSTTSLDMKSSEDLLDEMLEEQYRGQAETYQRISSRAWSARSASRSTSKNSTPVASGPVENVVPTPSSRLKRMESFPPVRRSLSFLVPKSPRRIPTRSLSASSKFDTELLKSSGSSSSSSSGGNGKENSGESGCSFSPIVTASSPEPRLFSGHRVCALPQFPSPRITKRKQSSSTSTTVRGLFYFTSQERESIEDLVYAVPRGCEKHETCTECTDAEFAYQYNKTISTTMPPEDRQRIINNNRSLRTIKNELENLVETGAINDEVFDTIMRALPSESSLSTNSRANAPSPSVPTNEMNNLSVQSSAPPSYAPSVPNRQPSAPPANELTRAIALYRYDGTAQDDCKFDVGDNISVTQYVNDDWWMGRNIRTGQEGIFPKNYVQVSQSNYKAPGAPASYGNEKANYAPQYPYQQQAPPPGPSNPYDSSVPPMAIASQPTDSKPGKGAEMGKKFGKKLGNAAIFGAGASIGGNIVNSIF